MSKIKTITVSHSRYREVGKPYRIERITDTIEFAPHEYLTSKQVEELCQSKEWKVTIVPKE